MKQEVWAPVIAGIAALILAPLGALFVQRRKNLHDDHETREQQRLDTYIEILAAAGSILINYGTLRQLVDINSRWFHGLNQLLKAAPAQPTQMDLFDAYRVPMERLVVAWSKALLLFDQEEIAAVNRLVDVAKDFDFTIPANDPASAEYRLGQARRDFAAVAREKLGERAVEFAIQIAPSAQDTSTDGT